jgi:hypothetical protein
MANLNLPYFLLSYSNCYFTDTEHPTHNHFDDGAGGAAAAASAQRRTQQPLSGESKAQDRWQRERLRAAFDDWQ